MPQFFKDPLFCCEARNMKLCTYTFRLLHCKGNYLARTDACKTGSSIAPKSHYRESLWSRDVLQRLGIKDYKSNQFENCLLERSWILEKHGNLFCSMPLARACCSHQKVKQEVPGWPPPLHRVISSSSSTKIQSVVILRKITGWFGDKEGRDLHNKIYCSVGCSL